MPDDKPQQGPVGQGNWVVEPGEGMSYIAEKSGFFWKTLWQLPENKALAEARNDPDVLLPGDRVTVPALRQKSEQRQTDLVHVFKRKGVPFLIRFYVLDEEGEAIANRPYRLKVGTRLYEGRSGKDGLIEHWVTPSARQAQLSLMAQDDPGEVERVWQIAVGHLEPKGSIRGVQARLANLGYFAGEPTGEMEEETRAALMAFQAAAGLSATGELDSDTEDALDAAHNRD